MDRDAARSADQLLADSERRLKLALEVSRLGLWEWDLHSGRLRCSEEMLRITGLDAAGTGDVDIMAARRLVHPDDVEVIWASEEAARTGQPFHAEYRMVLADGAVRWVENHARTECDAQGRPSRMIGTLADITERKNAEEALRSAHAELESSVLERTQALLESNAQLVNEVAERRAMEEQVRELFGQLVMAEEEERRRLARELHDSLGQHVTALTLGLDVVGADAELPGSLRHRLEQLKRAAAQLDRDIDRLVYQVRPTVLDDLGLDDALHEHARTWGEESGTVVDLHTVGLRGRRFPPALESTVYRMVQEALNNVRKHAFATRVAVIVELRGGELRAIVEDNGRGFETSTPQSASGKSGHRLGLRGMAERASLAGGRLEVETAPDRGTTVFLTIPLPQQEEPA
jgi:PAS domain S-box-containing protein